MYLLDSCVLSDARRHVPAITNWIGTIDPDDAFLSTITLGEFEKGIALLRRRDIAQASLLERWLDGIRVMYASRFLAIDEEVAMAWGRLMAQRTRPVADALIAATALTHGLIVVTRNVADFADTGVHITNPWAG
jgi:predicted nucleic acid-binding protein